MPEKHGFSPEQALYLHKVIRTYARRATAGFLILAVGLGYTIFGNSRAIHDSKERGQAVRGIICQLVKDGDATLYAYYDEGTINYKQLQRALHKSQEARKVLQGNNCDTSFTTDTNP